MSSEKTVKIVLSATTRFSSEGVDAVKAQAAEINSAQQKLAQTSEEAGASITDTWDRIASSMDKMMDRMPDLIRGLEAAGKAGKGSGPASPGTDTAELIRRATARINTAEGTAAPGALRPSEMTSIERALATSNSYLERALRQGADAQTVKDLTERIKLLTSEVEKQRKAAEAGQGGNGAPPMPPSPGPTPPPVPPSSGAAGGGIVNDLLNGLRGMGGRGLGGMGMMGGLIGRLGVPGLAIGGAAYAYNAVTNLLTSSNDPARKEGMGTADLARQYGYDRNPLGLFRDANNNTRGDLATLGYTAQDAEGIAAQYNRPGAMRGDVTGILRFSRSTGMEEGQVSNATRALGISGAFGKGDDTKALQTLKQAMAEGLREGVAGSDTFKQLVGFAEANYRQGVTSSQQSLQYTAGLQQALAATGNKSLQGEAGADATSKLLQGVSGNQDPAMQAMLLKIGGLPSARDLGLTGDAAAGYEAIAKRSPMAAMQQATGIIAAGGGTGALHTNLARTISTALGNDPAQMSAYLKSMGFGPSQILEIIGHKGGFAGVFSDAQTAAGRMARGSDLSLDVQGRNPADAASRAIETSDADTKLSGSLASMNLTGDTELTLRLAKQRASQGLTSAMNGTSNALGKTLMPSGSLLGPTGSGSLIIAPNDPRAPVASSSPQKLADMGVALMNGGLESPVSDGVNGRTGAFGGTQIMPSNLTGAKGWDREYMGSDTSRVDGMGYILSAAGLNPKDPIPDSVAKGGGDAIKKWRAGLSPNARSAVDMFLAQTSKFKLNQYMSKSMATGADKNEAYQRAILTWYQWNGGKWLDSKTPMDQSNPKWDARPAPGEPSPHEYLDKHMAALNGALSGRAAAQGISGEAGNVLGSEIATLGGTAITFDAGRAYSAATRAKYPSLPATHQGMDIQIGGKGGGDKVTNPFAGARVLAAKTGTKDGYGNYVDLDLGGGVTSRMAHFQSLNVKAGQTLGAGQTIGLEGHTGNADGDHLHMELRKNGKAITDPNQWIQEFLRQQQLRGTSDAGGMGGATAAARVMVEFKGLDNIHVTGATGIAAAKIKQGAALIATGVGESIAPASHRGA